MKKNKYEAQREAEMARGQAVVAQHILSERFNPEHVPETYPVNISREERARRDEYRSRMQGRAPK